MLKLRLILLYSSILLLGNAMASSPQWMKYPQVSPDGTKIAFTYQGNIYTVSTNGGLAKQITSHPAHDTRPIWSPNGKQIAFASDRHGSFDIFIVDEQGGVPKRLTTHSANEYPLAFENNEHIIFSAAIFSFDTQSGIFPSRVFPKTFKVSTKGTRPTLFSSLSMESLSFASNGKQLLYQNKKGYEDPFRKHHQSSVAREIWLYNQTFGKYTKQTPFRGENLNPVWHPQDGSFYYLSQENGSLNVYQRELNSDVAKQITFFDDGPVRSLSISMGGLLCFEVDGQLYKKAYDQQPQRINVSILTDNSENTSQNINFSSGATEVAVSPNNTEIAFVVRGEIFVTSLKYGTTRRITNTPEQERNISFSPDGRSILYASERNGVWGIYQSTLTLPSDNAFLYAQAWKEEPLVTGANTSYQPLYSPDGKRVAFLENRTTLRMINLDDKKITTLLDGKYNYSYTDSDQWFRWSPDGKWITTQYIGIGGWHNIDIILVSTDGSGTIHNLTQSGYRDVGPRFSQSGNAIIWLSDRAGYRSHGSWGAHRDAYIMFLTQEEHEKFLRSKEEAEWQKEQSKADSTSTKHPDITPAFDFKNSFRRVARLTPSSSAISDIWLNPNSDKLYYICYVQNSYDLWETDLKTGTVKVISPNVGAGLIHTDKEQKNIIFIANGQIKKIELATGKVSPISIQAQFNYLPQDEREYIFHHVWRQMKDKFYVTDLHNTNWDKMLAKYQQFLPYINNNHDFSEMMSEMLGELNVSHTGSRYRPSLKSPATSSLGILIDPSYQGAGIKIAEILPLGPLDKANSSIQPGSIITAIDNVPIGPEEDFFPLLAGKANKRVLISFVNAPNATETTLWIKPISLSLEEELLYQRWVEKRREMTEKLSNGQIGYIHVKGMNSDSFRETYSRLLGQYRNYKAVVIDTRHNGGGWLHDDLVSLLNGKEYQRFTPRGQYIGSDPYNKWTKPSIVLMCEDNYSNAHGFPWLYKELKIGKLVGTPVPGTMTAVWWETQIDPTLVVGFPQVAVEDMRGNYLENQELMPDIEVYNSPQDQQVDNDVQLQKAISELLKEVHQ